MKEIIFNIIVITFVVVMICFAGRSDFESMPIPSDHQIGTLIEINSDYSVFEGKRDGQLWAVKDCLFQYSIGTEFMLYMDRKKTVIYDDDEVIGFRYIQ